MAGVTLSSNALSVSPGGDAVCTVTIRNTSAVVDSYSVTVLGEAAAWATVVPASVSLFPGAEGTAEVHFRPVRSSGLPAGPVDFAVRVLSTESGDSVVEEGVATVEAFADVAARITPRTSEAKRRAKYVVTIDNKGNAPASFSVLASDPDEALVFDATPPEVDIGPGESGSVSVTAAARKGFARGPAQHRPFQAVVSPRSSSAAPVQLDATLVQKAGMPAIVPALVVGAVILLAAAVLLPGLTKDDGKSAPFTLTNAGGSTTSVVAAAADGGDDDAGEADAESADGGAPASEGAGGGTGDEPRAPSPVTAAGGGPAAGATSTTVSTEDEEVVTTVDEAPVTSTTAPPATAPPAPRQQFAGSWQHSTGCVTFKVGDTMVVTGALNGVDMSGTGSGADADDLDFVVKARRGAQDRYMLVNGVLNVPTAESRVPLQLQRVKTCS